MLSISGELIMSRYVRSRINVLYVAMSLYDISTMNEMCLLTSLEYKENEEGSCPSTHFIYHFANTPIT